MVVLSTIPLLFYMRTNVYIDGFNLYYGCVNHSQYKQYKWLNIKALIRQLLNDTNQIEKIYYFTAKIKGNDARRKLRQQIYIKALQSTNIEIIYGDFRIREKNREEVGTGRRVCVYNPEEKGSDVNMACYMLRDAYEKQCNCSVLVSNDRDLLTAVKMVKNIGNKVGIIFPIAIQNRKKVISLDLRNEATFTKEIKKKHLAENQLPERISSDIYKPREWYKIK